MIALIADLDSAKGWVPTDVWREAWRLSLSVQIRSKHLETSIRDRCGRLRCISPSRVPGHRRGPRAIGREPFSAPEASVPGLPRGWQKPAGLRSCTWTWLGCGDIVSRHPMWRRFWPAALGRTWGFETAHAVHSPLMLFCRDLFHTLYK